LPVTVVATRPHWQEHLTLSRAALILYAAAFEAHKDGREIIFREKHDGAETKLNLFFPEPNGQD
jgi:hypothetical protein